MDKIKFKFANGQPFLRKRSNIKGIVVGCVAYDPKKILVRVQWEDGQVIDYHPAKLNRIIKPCPVS